VSYDCERKGCFNVLALRSFVTAKVLLGLCKRNVLAELRAVLLERQLLRRVHSVLGGVVNALARLLAHESDDFALIAFFCHIPVSLTDRHYICNNQKCRVISSAFIGLARFFYYNLF